MRMSHVYVAALVLTAMQGACGSSSPPQARSAMALPTPTTTAKPETVAQARQTGTVQISPDILKACGMKDADAYFPFDSSRLEKKDIAPLNAVAACFSTGPLKGHSANLVGRADSRGASEYNLTLGQARADGVGSYLEGKGLDKAKVESTSRGAMDATGTDEAGWSHDRRVDVLLLK